LQIDGCKTVKEIGQFLEKKYGENVYPLYERLLVFLNYINVECRYIEKLKY
ncbi:MAG: PqqD family peptide modification chaperone, partial [Clostridium sp.]|nr:PqqD family peptide modification chaperone [Clostridium sp.]